MSFKIEKVIDNNAEVGTEGVLDGRDKVVISEIKENQVIEQRVSIDTFIADTNAKFSSFGSNAFERLVAVMEASYTGGASVFCTDITILEQKISRFSLANDLLKSAFVLSGLSESPDLADKTQNMAKAIGIFLDYMKAKDWRVQLWKSHDAHKKTIQELGSAKVDIAAKQKEKEEAEGAKQASEAQKAAEQAKKDAADTQRELNAINAGVKAEKGSRIIKK